LLRKLFILYSLANPAASSGECARCSIHEPKANNIFLLYCAPYPAYKAGLAGALPVTCRFATNSRKKQIIRYDSKSLNFYQGYG
jgi:hypothetical protein